MQTRTIKRCAWVKAGDKLYERYHDQEWGKIVKSDKKLFEFIVLESAQAGLSWLTVLKKRPNYKRAFANFDPKQVAKFTARDVKRLLNDAGIIRNRAKILAAINNAKIFLKIQTEFGSFYKYQWSFVNQQSVTHCLRKLSDYPTTTPAAESFAKDLKNRGFKFFGPTVAYAHMQAVGVVHDHMQTCYLAK